MILLLSVDHSRVKLSFTTSKNDSDYINASFIKVNRQRPHVQLCQLTYKDSVPASRGCPAPLSTLPLRARCPTPCWTSSGCSGSTTQRYEPSVGARQALPGHYTTMFCFTMFFFLASGCDNGLSWVWDGKGNDVSSYSFAFSLLFPQYFCSLCDIFPSI